MKLTLKELAELLGMKNTAAESGLDVLIPDLMGLF